MPKVYFCDDAYECAVALKGNDYVHLLDASGCMIAAFDAVASFDDFVIEDGDWTAPKSNDSCNIAVVREDGTIGKGSHKCSDIKSENVVNCYSDAKQNPIAINGTYTTTYSLIGSPFTFAVLNASLATGQVMGSSGNRRISFTNITRDSATESNINIATFSVAENGKTLKLTSSVKIAITKSSSGSVSIGYTDGASVTFGIVKTLLM